MPPLTLHMGLAKEVAAALQHKGLEADLGAYYLGSTAPDIRVITRWDRRRTHFFDLDCFERQDCVHALFAEHPHLANLEGLNGATASFLAGYLTHLVMDETWIEYVYRPCFGERSDLGGDARANVMDRVLQYELDRRDRAAIMEQVRDELAGTALEVYVGFIDKETLEEWRRVALDIGAQEPDWQRFRVIAGRHLRQYFGENDSPEALDQFMREVPELLDRTIRHVGWDRIEAFLHRSRTRSAEVIREYLR